MSLEKYFKAASESGNLECPSSSPVTNQCRLGLQANWQGAFQWDWLRAVTHFTLSQGVSIRRAREPNPSNGSI